MRFGNRHTDKYVYSHSRRCWVKAICGLGETDMYCTAPKTYPRGTQFDYNTVLTTAEEYVACGKEI